MDKKVFFKNSLWMTATSLILRFAGLLFRVYLSHRIGAEGIGLYQLVYSVYILGATFASAGLSTAITRMVAEAIARKKPGEVRTVMRLCLILSVSIGCISAILLLVFATPIGTIIQEPRSIQAIRLSGLSLPFMGISGCYRGFFAAKRKMRVPCFAQMIAQGVRILFCVLSLTFYATANLSFLCSLLIIGDGLAEGIASLYMVICGNKHRENANPSKEPVKPILKSIGKIALPLTLGQYVSTGLRTTETLLVPLLLTRYTGSSADSLSQFGAVKGIALPTLFFPSALLLTVANLLIPELSVAKAMHNTCQIKRLTLRMLRITFIGSVFIGCLFTGLGKPIGLCVFGNERVGLYLSILGPLVPVMYLDSIANCMLKALGEQNRTLLYMTADAVLRIAFIFVIVPRYGITGMIFVMVISNLFTSLLSYRRLLTVTRCGGLPIKTGITVILFGFIATASFVIPSSRYPITSPYIRLAVGSIVISVLYWLFSFAGGLLPKFPHPKKA